MTAACGCFGLHNSQIKPIFPRIRRQRCQSSSRYLFHLMRPGYPSIRIVVFLALCALHAAPLAAQEKENSEFKLAVSLYNDSMFDLAAEQFKNFIAAYPAASQGTEARFYLG